MVSPRSAALSFLSTRFMSRIRCAEDTAAKAFSKWRYNTDFLRGVMRGCADREEGTWISEEFIEVYGAMHRLGKAHSVEVLF